MLCYLQGLTYLEASRQLNVSEGVSPRPAGTGEETTTRSAHTTWRDHSGGLLTAMGAAGSSPGSVDASRGRWSIPRFASRWDLLLVTSAKLLARGVLSSMFLNQLKVLAVLMLVGVAGSLGFVAGACRGIAGSAQDFRQSRSR